MPLIQLQWQSADMLFHNDQSSWLRNPNLNWMCSQSVLPQLHHCHSTVLSMDGWKWMSEWMDALMLYYMFCPSVTICSQYYDQHSALPNNSHRPQHWVLTLHKNTHCTKTTVQLWLSTDNDWIFCFCSILFLCMCRINNSNSPLFFFTLSVEHAVILWISAPSLCLSLPPSPCSFLFLCSWGAPSTRHSASRKGPKPTQTSKRLPPLTPQLPIPQRCPTMG